MPRYANAPGNPDDVEAKLPAPTRAAAPHAAAAGPVHPRTTRVPALLVRAVQADAIPVDVARPPRAGKAQQFLSRRLSAVGDSWELFQHVDGGRLIRAFEVVEHVATRVEEGACELTDPHHLLAAEADGWWRLE